MKRIVAGLLCCSLLGGCAFSRTTIIRSRPAGATVKVSGETLGRTPLHAKIGCKTIGQKELEISKEGFRTLETGLEQKARGRNIFWSIFFAPAGLVFLFFVAKCPKLNYDFALEAETAQLAGQSTLTVVKLDSELDVYVGGRRVLGGQRMAFPPGWQEVSADIRGQVRRVGEILMEPDRDYVVDLEVNAADTQKER